jgi:hypothetical protein
MTIVGDAKNSSVILIIIYNCNMFILQATGYIVSILGVHSTSICYTEAGVLNILFRLKVFKTKESHNKGS